MKQGGESIPGWGISTYKGPVVDQSTASMRNQRKANVRAEPRSLERPEGVTRGSQMLLGHISPFSHLQSVIHESIFTESLLGVRTVFQVRGEMYWFIGQVRILFSWSLHPR